MDTNELRNELTPSPIQAPIRPDTIQSHTEADSSRESTPDLMNASQEEPVILVDQAVVDPMTQSMVMSQGFGEAPAAEASLVDFLQPDQQRQDMISPMSDRSVEAVEGKLELKLETDSYDYKVEDDDDDYVAPVAVAPQSDEYDYAVADKSCPEEVKAGTADASDSDAESVCSETEAAQEVTGTLSFSVAAEAPLTTTVTQASSDMTSLGSYIPQAEANDNIDNVKEDSSDDDDNDQADHVPNIINVDDEDDLNEKLKHMSMTSSVMVESTTKPFATDDNDDNDDAKSSDSSSDSDSDEDMIKPSHDNAAKVNDDEDDKSSSSSSDSEDDAEKPFQEHDGDSDSDSDSDNEAAVDDIKEVANVADSIQEPRDVLDHHHDNETVEDRHDVHGALAELEDTIVHEETVSPAGDSDFMPGMQQTLLPASQQQEEPTTADRPINILDSASTEEGPADIPDSDGINGLCTAEVKRFFSFHLNLLSREVDRVKEKDIN